MTYEQIQETLSDLVKNRPMSIRQLAALSTVSVPTVTYWLYHPEGVDPRLSTTCAMLKALGYELEIVKGENFGKTKEELETLSVEKILGF